MKDWCQATVIRYYIKLAFSFTSSNLSRFNTIPNGSEKGAGGILQKEAINKIAPSIEKRL
jgi:hypothetical protein